MITLTRLNESHIVVNADLIEFLEALPDTIVTLTTGQKIMVRETVDEVVDKVVRYKRNLYAGPVIDKQSPDRKI